ncbi:MAG: hypothetical protein H7833_06975 [Magnetococcus sp. DMHC-1]|nr:hypothetical protein [Magnetococcales bacterium]MBF0154983.1 hypothetical protein [Magnetococcales bacterium]
MRSNHKETPLPLAILVLVLLLVGCSRPAPDKMPVDRENSNFTWPDLAKTDVNLFVETNQHDVMGYLKQLMIKLYRRNPNQLQRGTVHQAEANVGRVFGTFHNWEFAELNNVKGVDCIRLAFQESFTGDRVLAYTVGLGSMIMASYENKREFYVLDSLDPQKLYNSARNLELALWLLTHDRDSHGNLFLLSNESEGTVRNLSYERLFGKMIGLQDALSRVVAQKTKRLIKQALQFLIFLPI